MSVQETIRPELQEIDREKNALAAQLRDFRVVDAETYVVAGDLLKRVTLVIDRIHAKLDPHVKLSDEAHKGLVALRKEALEGPLGFRVYLGNQMSDYDNEQERIRIERQAEANRKAQKEADDLKLARAEEAAETGQPEVAEQILEEPDNVPVPFIPKGTPKMTGISHPERWKGEIVDLKAYVSGICKGQVPLSGIIGIVEAKDGVGRVRVGIYKCAFLNKQVVAMKGEAQIRYPGVRVWSEKGVATRRA